ncbi:unnamed protein product [Mytilus coruscus]|uniref:Integrase zinc-binding domain-containing protein n=1 Tax=Mytilus coruscus TaxID=42192 RepID=A0A6J8AZF2_MYTCO|nr:unnamed protein product [Mytilus coruscus]
MSVNCLIDTGSTLSVIHIRKFLSIPKFQRPDKIYEGIQLKLANGEIIKIMGQADFNIKINDKIWKQRFVIAEIDGPAIIGYNFLYSKNCKLDIRHSKLTIEDFEIVCQKESQMSSIFKIASEHNVILPPNSETIIMSKALGDSSHLMDAMIEPIMKQDNEILVARALGDPSNGQIPLRIANLTSFERTLYKSTCLAECHLCDNILEIENTERTSPPILSYPDMNKKFILDTDASGFGIGTVLSQVHENGERVVAYYSKSFSKTERQYCVTRRELVGRQDWNADELSRRPCTQCTHCIRQETNESYAEEEPSCYLRAVKTAEPDSTIREEIEIESTEQGVNWTQSKTTEEILAAQQQDDTIAIILKLKSENQPKPKWEDISLESKQFKTYWAQWDRLRVINGLLYREWVSNVHGNVKQSILPLCWHDQVLKMLHDDPVAGHFGIHRTLARVSSRFYWTGYKETIEIWCKCCEICSARKGPMRHPRGPMKQYLVGAPLERVAIDILGPLLEAKNKNKYILGITDYFSRWADRILCPIKKQKLSQEFLSVNS